MDPLEWRDEQLRTFPTLRWSRYATIASVVICLWDHCLTFSEEVRLIWPSRAIFVKRAFLANRYIVPMILIVNIHTQSGLSTAGLSDEFCRGWIMTVFCLAGLSLAVSQWLMLLKLWKLWGARKKVILTTLAGYFILQTGSIIWLVLNAREAVPMIHYSHTARMCGLMDRPHLLRGLYAWLLFFEIVAYLMVCYNGLSRPREVDDKLLHILIRDGVLFFMATVTLRVLNLVMAVLDVPTQIFLGIYCIWGVITTIVSRMILNTRRIESDEKGSEDWHDSLVEMQEQLDKYGDTIMICRENMTNPGLSLNASDTPPLKWTRESYERIGNSLEIAETLKGGSSDGENSPKKWVDA